MQQKEHKNKFQVKATGIDLQCCLDQLLSLIRLLISLHEKKNKVLEVQAAIKMKKDLRCRRK